MVSVILLAGGGSQRLGRDKLLLRREGKTLLHAVIEDALTRVPDPGAPVVIVGPTRETPVSRRVHWTREKPPGGGPVAAIAAGLRLVDSILPPSARDPLVGILAGDSPRGPRALPALLASLEGSPHADVAVLTDGDRRHYLCAAFRTRVLRARLGDLPATGASMRDLYEGRVVVDVIDRWGAAEDIDTPDDATRLGYS